MKDLHIENIFLELYLNVTKNYELFVVLSYLFSEMYNHMNEQIFFIVLYRITETCCKLHNKAFCIMTLNWFLFYFFRLCEVTVASFMFHNESKIMKSLFISIGRFYRRSSRDICANSTQRKLQNEKRNMEISIFQDVRPVITSGVSRYFSVQFRVISCRIIVIYLLFTFTYRCALEKCLKPNGNKSCCVIFKINLKSNPWMITLYLFNLLDQYYLKSLTGTHQVSTLIIRRATHGWAF